MMIKIPTVQTVNVLYHEQKVGRLAVRPDNRCIFEYDPSWIAHGFSISPFQLPLKPETFTAPFDPFDGLFGTFNDSLTDGWANLLLDRWLREHGTEPHALDWLQRLCLIGNTGMGALSYKPAVTRENTYNDHPIAFYARKIKHILHDKKSEHLDELVEKGGSPGGARPKVLLTIDGEEWLIKFPAHNDPETIGLTEFGYSRAANKAGIEMTECRLYEEKYFGTKRFDRISNQSENPPRKIHVITARGLLNTSHRYLSPDYKDLLKATFILTQSMKEVSKLFRLMVFNVANKNKDDHAKKFSYLYSETNKHRI